jgi:hypothetical protein
MFRSKTYFAIDLLVSTSQEELLIMNLMEDGEPDIQNLGPK